MLASQNWNEMIANKHELGSTRAKLWPGPSLPPLLEASTLSLASLVVVLMLTLMLVYVMTKDPCLRLGTRETQPAPDAKL
jgi:hypothetical protein